MRGSQDGSQLLLTGEGIRLRVRARRATEVEDM